MDNFLEDLKGDLDIPGFDEEILKQMVSEAEDVTDKIYEYGTLDDEQIQNIKENSERKERKIQRFENEQKSLQHLEESIPYDSEEEIEKNDEEREFIICPNCGEKIWL